MLGSQWTLAALDEVDKVLKVVRALYKGHDKSNNKLYEDTGTEKNRRRNIYAKLAENSIEDSRDAEETKDMSVVELGAHLVSNKITYGNCSEMTAATIDRCLNNQTLQAKMQHLWTAKTQVPGDHIFVLVSDGPLCPPRKVLPLARTSPLQARDCG